MTPTPIRYIVKSLLLIPRLLCRQLTKLLPRNHKKVCIGAWFGNLYADNPKYFAVYLLANTDYDLTWIGNKSVKEKLPAHPRLHFACKGSWTSTFALLKAKFWVCCIFCSHDLTSLPIDGGVVRINLWHGIPIKNLGQNSIWDKNSQSSKGLHATLERFYCRIISGGPDWIPVSSDDMPKIMANGFPEKFDFLHSLPYGTPRNDFLICNRENEQLRQTLKRKYSNLLGFNPDKKIVLYLPTWRSYSKNIFCFFDCDSSQQKCISETLDNNNAVLIEKHHFHTYETKQIPHKHCCSIPVIGKLLPLIDIQELLLISDILICDYSSVYLDYALLMRPIIHFLYDYDEYAKMDSGLAYNIEDIGGGDVAYTFNELLKSLGRNLSVKTYNPKLNMPECIKYEQGHSCEQLLALMKAQAET